MQLNYNWQDIKLYPNKQIVANLSHETDVASSMKEININSSCTILNIDLK